MAQNKLNDLRSIPESKRAPMRRNQSETMVRCVMIDHKVGKDETIEALCEQEHTNAYPFALKLMLRRIAAYAPGCLVRDPTILFLGSICRSPGEVVMWCFYLVRRARELGRAVTIEDLAFDFPLGFPTEDAMGEHWDAQKGWPGTRIDNRLDQPDEWLPDAATAEGEALPDPITGVGVFAWPGEERRSDRYGVIGLEPEGYEGNGRTQDAGWQSPISALHGRRCSITARVIEARESAHVGDIVRGIFPSQPEVGAVINLGVGELFVEQSAGFTLPTFGIKPDDGRRTDWFDPRDLYRLHDQTVEITIEPVVDDGARPERKPEGDRDAEVSGFVMDVRENPAEADGAVTAQVKFSPL